MRKSEKQNKTSEFGTLNSKTTAWILLRQNNLKNEPIRTIFLKLRHQTKLKAQYWSRWNNHGVKQSIQKDNIQIRFQEDLSGQKGNKTKNSQESNSNLHQINSKNHLETDLLPALNWFRSGKLNHDTKGKEITRNLVILVCSFTLYY